MTIFRPLLLVLLTLWLALPLAALAQSASPPACHQPDAPRCLLADDSGGRQTPMSSETEACCHFYATASHANVGQPPLSSAEPGVRVGRERGGQPQFIPPVATRPPAV